MGSNPTRGTSFHPSAVGSRVLADVRVGRCARAFQERSYTSPLMDRPSSQITDSRRSNVGAHLIVDAFDAYRSRYRIITRRSQLRFEQRDWAASAADAIERLALYRGTVDELESAIRGMLGDRIADPFLWAGMKAVYSGLIADRDDWELAETFFNSMTRRIFDTVGVDEHIEFVDTDFDTPPTRASEPVYRTYDRSEAMTDLLVSILDDVPFESGWANQIRDLDHVAERISNRLAELGALQVVERAEIVESVFYRGQSAFVIGRLYSGSHRLPLVLALSHGTDGIFVDAVLLTSNEVSILFSFTRSYFHVDAHRPYDLVRFLKSLMPRKRLAEIYIAVGENKHGKTELYRDLIRHVSASPERFEHARGTPGMVMVVFTLPGYDDVFKIIRDRFPPPKRTTRRTIMDKYRLVFQHDRAGRLIDAQDFQHLQFDRRQFTDELLEELLTEAGDTVRIEGDDVVISHVYVERRVIPLNIFVKEAAPLAAQGAVIDFGQAIKDMASTNIFPGDLLLKNFGVTRHGRVVFYDYDELSSITEMVFRAIPEARNDMDEMSSTPWYSVGDRDVFPEEHRRFLGLSPELREVFEQNHADLFEVEPWKAIQEAHRVGRAHRGIRLPGRVSVAWIGGTTRLVTFR